MQEGIEVYGCVQVSRNNKVCMRAPRVAKKIISTRPHADATSAGADVSKRELKCPTCETVFRSRLGLKYHVEKNVCIRAKEAKAYELPQHEQAPSRSDASSAGVSSLGITPEIYSELRMRSLASAIKQNTKRGKKRADRIIKIYEERGDAPWHHSPAYGRTIGCPAHSRRPLFDGPDWFPKHSLSEVEMRGNGDDGGMTIECGTTNVRISRGKSAQLSGPSDIACIVGLSVRSISFSRLSSSRAYMCVSGCPRQTFHSLCRPSQTNVDTQIQIWTFECSGAAPNVQFAYTLCEKGWGTALSVSWCPLEGLFSHHTRAGILAVLSSDGIVRILSPPSPSKVAAGSHVNASSCVCFEYSPAERTGMSLIGTCISWRKRAEVTSDGNAVAALAIGLSDGSVVVAEFMDARDGEDGALYVDQPGTCFSRIICNTRVVCERFESFIPAREGFLLHPESAASSRAVTDVAWSPVSVRAFATCSRNNIVQIWNSDSALGPSQRFARNQNMVYIGKLSKLVWTAIEPSIIMCVSDAGLMQKLHPTLGWFGGMKRASHGPIWAIRSIAGLLPRHCHRRSRRCSDPMPAPFNNEVGDAGECP